MRSRRSAGKVAKGYGSERELCDHVMEWARAGGCAVYPETSGWDVLLVAPSTEQIGIQAKMRTNAHVIEQAITGTRESKGPDIVAVAVPDFDRSFSCVVEELGFTTIEGSRLFPRGYLTFEDWLRLARRRVTLARCWVPEVEIALPAGVPNPRTLSPWKFAAAKLCARLRAGDELVRKDFADLGVRLDLWMQRRWIRRVHPSRPARYVMFGPGGRPLPDLEFPEISIALGLPAPC